MTSKSQDRKKSSPLVCYSNRVQVMVKVSWLLLKLSQIPQTTTQIESKSSPKSWGFYSNRVQVTSRSRIKSRIRVWHHWDTLHILYASSHEFIFRSLENKTHRSSIPLLKPCRHSHFHSSIPTLFSTQNDVPEFGGLEQSPEMNL